ncbi:FAD-dependent oxidoreductase [Actinoplanes friuliensis]|uniref:FAD dependent oxidoreductase n=1 Tax=Actinoplanes friuliensis DSM 7358 TaxID=1246995 RepID=U5W6I7_9ACTN|nr:FAD-dependent oxidoreductase [Actinoplanes friuliensis]AGZ44828.1 FAD dependent oxidoreductase [Actinoplanes friuliensis DSM 7358]
MKVAIVGAGPTGLYTAIALARRGHRVTVVDRDPGPAPDGGWERRGVMQFHHPHGLRRQIITVLDAEMPDVRQGLLSAGAELTILPAEGQRPRTVIGMQCGRMTFERVLREAAVAQPGVTFLAGHADDVLSTGGRATGLRVDGAELPADLVLNASGRNGRLADDLRVPGDGSDCGLSYVSRQYALLPGAEPGPTNVPIGLISRFPGYLAGVFLQDNRTVSLLIARPSTDRQLADLRFEAAFEAAVRAIPGLREWTDPDRTTPITGVLPGGHLRNTYRGQLDPGGRVPLPGLIHVGDTVCTTNPTAGRGITTSLLQAHRLVNLLDGSTDVEAVTLELDTWCTEQIRPWYDDHVSWDADQVRQWSGEDVDLNRPLTSGHIVEAAAAEPPLMRVIGPYLTMEALPATLAEVEPQVREIYHRGWRPAVPAGPTRDELVSLIAPVLT